MDYYELLGVERSATNEQISSAYRKLAFQYHPDRIRDPDLAQRSAQKFKEITEAYQTLTDTSKRAIYNAKNPVKKQKPAKKMRNMTAEERWDYIMANDPNLQKSTIISPQAPKYDIWGRPLSQAERLQWMHDNSSNIYSNGWGIPQKKKTPPPPKDGFVDVFAKYYEKDNPPTLNR